MPRKPCKSLSDQDGNVRELRAEEIGQFRPLADVDPELAAHLHDQKQGAAPPGRFLIIGSHPDSRLLGV
jgi:hypothetical protein